MSYVSQPARPHPARPHPASRQPASLTPTRAFTLIEILLVIVIIGILVSISLVVGKQVRVGSQSRSTEDTIRVLDQSLVGYEKTSSELPPSKFVYRDIKTSPKAYEYPFVDGRREMDGVDRDLHPAILTLARYTALCSTIPEADSLIQSVNPKLVRRVVIDANLKTPPLAVEILDAFGRPIRFVHPAFDGGYGPAYDPAKIALRDLNRTATSDATSNPDPLGNVYRRSARPFDPAVPLATSPNPVGDGDEGICPSRRPYFYSAGPDGDPGTRSNNVYTTRPTYPTETAKIK